MDIDDLRDSVENGPKEGWTNSGGPGLLRENLQALVGGLEELRVGLEKDKEKKLKVLKDLMNHQVKTNPHYRVKKNGN